MSPAASGGGHLKVTQVRSAITTKPKHRGTLRALGLRGVGRSRVLADTDALQGMLARVPHLVEVTAATEDEVSAQRARTDAARTARRRAQGQAAAAPAPARARRATKAPASKAPAAEAAAPEATEGSS